MGKALLITTENEIKEVEIDFNNHSDNETNKQIRGYIGEDCEYYEMIPSYFLSETCGLNTYPSSKNGVGVCLLLDEEGKLKGLKENYTATFLYTSYEPIVGNVLLVATAYNTELDFAPIPEELLPSLKNVLEKIANSVNKHLGDL